MTIAALVACVVINILPNFTRDERAALIHRAARFLAPMVLMPLLGVWYFLAIPADSRSWVLGGSAAMTLFFAIGVGASLLIGVLRDLRPAAAAALHQRRDGDCCSCRWRSPRRPAASSSAKGSASRSRSATCSTRTRSREDEVAKLRERGCTTDDPYPLRNAELYPNPQVAKGAQVFATSAASATRSTARTAWCRSHGHLVRRADCG